MIRRVSYILGGRQPLIVMPNEGAFVFGIERFNTVVVVRRSYFTNTDLMKKDDPYATLGLHWGATTSEIKSAFKEKARKLHPDVNKIDSAEEALKKFQIVQKAYSALMDVKGAPHRDDLLEVSSRQCPILYSLNYSKQRTERSLRLSIVVISRINFSLLNATL